MAKASKELEIEQARQHYSARRHAEAEAICMRLLERDPDDAEALHVAGLAANATGRKALGLASLQKAARLAPNHAQLHYNLAVTYGEAGRDAEAMLSYRNCLRLQPGHADAMWNYGELLRLSERFDLAVELFERLIDAGRIYPGIYHRTAVCYTFLGRMDAAAQMYEQELATGAFDKSLTLWEYSHLLLNIGDFARGWRAYERRFDSPKTSVSAHPFPYPRWNGESLADRTLLVHGEQGLGDELMFASCMPDLLAKAQAEGGRVIVACAPALQRLFAAAWPQAQVLAHQQMQAPAQIGVQTRVDYQLPIGSLALHFRSSAESFRGQKPYLHADAQRVEAYRASMATLAPRSVKALRVGVTWGSNPALHHRKAAVRATHKSIAPRVMLPLASEGACFVSLHYRELGRSAAEIPELDPLDFSEELVDLAETAALIEAMDLVITVDTSIAHLAGALGKETWLLLMKQADWRWGRSSSKCVWYPSVRMFRQSVQGAWAPVIEQVASALRERIANR